MSGYDDEGYQPRTVSVKNEPPPLRTRQPTGQAAYPLILLEGAEGGGKSYQLCALSASPRVGRTFILPLGERQLDEYKSLGPFEIVESNGTYGDFFGQLRAACAVPMAEGRPNVIGIDSGSALWALLSRWAETRARGTKRARQILAEDPDAEIDTSMTHWNAAKDRWRDVLDLLSAWPGIAVIVARGREVSKVANGQPVAGQTEWSIQAEKNVTSDTYAWVRMHRHPRRAELIAVRNLFVRMPDDGSPLALPLEATLDHLVFDLIGSGGEFGPSRTVLPVVGVSAARAKTRLVDAVRKARGIDEAKARDEAKRVWEESFPDGPTEVLESDLARVLLRFRDPELPAEGPEGEPLEVPPGAPFNGASRSESRALLLSMRKRDLVPYLEPFGLSTAGTNEQMVDRILDHQFGPQEGAQSDSDGSGQGTDPKPPDAAPGAAQAPLTAGGRSWRLVVDHEGSSHTVAYSDLGELLTDAGASPDGYTPQRVVDEEGRLVVALNAAGQVTELHRDYAELEPMLTAWRVGTTLDS